MGQSLLLRTWGMRLALLVLCSDKPGGRSTVEALLVVVTEVMHAVFLGLLQDTTNRIET